MPKTNRRFRMGSGAGCRIGSGEPRESDTSSRQKCRFPLPHGKRRPPFPATAVVPHVIYQERARLATRWLVVWFLSLLGPSPKAKPKSADSPNPEDDPPKSERARHDQHVRTMRAWAVKGKSPPGLGARLRHWREAGRGWTRAKLAAETGIAVAKLARMEVGRQHSGRRLPQARDRARGRRTDGQERARAVGSGQARSGAGADIAETAQTTPAGLRNTQLARSNMSAQAVRNDYAMVDPKSLKASGYNPNMLTSDQHRQLVDEVQRQGRLLKPIVCRDDAGQLIIVDGEHNWQAALEAGLTEIPVELVEVDAYEAAGRRSSGTSPAPGTKFGSAGCSEQMLAERSTLPIATLPPSLVVPRAPCATSCSMSGPPTCAPAATIARMRTPSRPWACVSVRELIARLEGLTGRRRAGSARRGRARSRASWRASNAPGTRRLSPSAASS